MSNKDIEKITKALIKRKENIEKEVDEVLNISNEYIDDTIKRSIIELAVLLTDRIMQVIRDDKSMYKIYIDYVLKRENKKR